MRIAFASSCFTRVLAGQPVWDTIAAQAPDHVVLLGDLLYLDVLTPQPPQEMADLTFAQHLFALYRELVAQPQLVALVRALPPGRVHAVWSDHDFLWHDACGAEMHPLHTRKLELSTAFHEAFREALAQQLAPGSFPDSVEHPCFWRAGHPLATPSVALAPDVWLHLSDGRTHRTRTWLRPESKRALLGAAQRQRFEGRLAAAPDALHLWASGSSLAEYRAYPQDLQWLQAQAARHRMLVLSGDRQRNALDSVETRGFPLHEASSSGAAVRDAVSAGLVRSNHGVVEIGERSLRVRLYRHGRVEARRTIARADWRPSD